MQGSNENTDDEMFIGFIASVVFIIVISLLVDYFRAEINSVLGVIAAIHVAPFAMMARLAPVIADIPYLGSFFFGQPEQVLGFFERGGFAGMTEEQSSTVFRIAARCVGFIYAPVLIWIAFRSVNLRPDEVYNKRHTIKSMKAEHAGTWKTTRMMRDFDPLLDTREYDLRKVADTVRRKLESTSPEVMTSLGSMIKPGTPYIAPASWNRSIRPEEWFVAHGATYDPVIFRKNAFGKVLPTPFKFTTENPKGFEFREKWEDLDLESIKELLESDMGPFWGGDIFRKPPHIRALVAVFALYYATDLDDARSIISDLGILSEGLAGKPKGSIDARIMQEPGFIDKIDGILKSQIGKNILKFGAMHAWFYPAMARMIEVCRKDRGVLACASFMWLKQENRKLWYLLSSVGNDVTPIEVAAPYAHFIAEKQNGGRLIRPAIYQAARDIHEDYLDMLPERIRDRRRKMDMKRSPNDTIRMFFAKADEDDLYESENFYKDKAPLKPGFFKRMMGRILPTV